MCMNKFFRNGLLMLAAGALVVSCADYNVTDDFPAHPDPSYVEPFKDLGPVKSYIDRAQYPNLSLGALLKVTDFNKQELAHAAAVTNFDDVAFGTTLMAGTIVNARGVMNFLDMSDLLTHVDEIGYTVYGSPLFANANQADDWLNTLTAPIEIPVDYVEGKKVDYTTMSSFDGTAESGSATIIKYDGMNVLKVPLRAKIRIIEGFEVDPKAKYTITFWATTDKVSDTGVSFNVTFSGTPVEGTGVGGKWVVKQGKWTKFVVEAQSAEGVTDGYLRIDNGPNGNVLVQKVDVGYYPDNHRPQTAQEISDTINVAVNEWCDGVMKINEGRITYQVVRPHR